MWREKLIPEESSSEGSSTPSSSSSSTESITPTSSISLTQQVGFTQESDEMKRAAAKKLIERYFYQLRDGCGNPHCGNKCCASSGEVKSLTPNQAAAKAIQLFSQDAELCDSHPSKVARTQIDGVSSFVGTSSSDNNIDSNTVNMTSLSNLEESLPQTSKSSQTSCEETIDFTSTLTGNRKVPFVDEEKMMDLIVQCKTQNSYSLLIKTLGAVFSLRQSVAMSFQKVPRTSIDAMLDKAPGDLKNLKKEDLRTLEGDLDKDEDSCADETIPLEPHHTTVDLPSLRRSMHKLYEANNSVFEKLNNALQSLATSLSIDLRILTQKEQLEEIITVFVIVFEILSIGSSEFLATALPAMCRAASHLPIWAQARISQIWSEHCQCGLKNMLEMLQQLITVQVVTSTDDRRSCVHENEIIISATKVMKMLYYANILAGDLEPKLREDINDGISTIAEEEEDEIFNYSSNKQNKSSTIEDPLAVELNVSVMDCRKPFFPFDDFYNEHLSDTIEMDKDYLNYKNKSDKTSFSFMLYSFILPPATKTLSLYFDSRIRMYNERRISILHTQIAGHLPNPYLKLKVRREQIIDDALVELEMIAMGNPKDFRKQLYVEFIGEQGIDEGGVSKEFFQLIVEQIFNADYGMFIHQEDTNIVWFNSTSFENEAQFTLIGIVLGLAIYNNIILAVNFPMVVYRKLMGLKGSFTDLEDWNPVLYNSLKSMLDYEENDMEEVFVQTFKISYKDIFGNTLYHELKTNGDNIFVNQDNKQDFVESYADFLLNQSIDKQFRAFRRGFQMVTDESPLHLLFRPEEIELLVCGSKKFDFNELEKATEYEGGYTEESETIKDFWNIVHALPMESKKKLLEFTTGSDRVPVGGLSRLKLVIARNGPDSDRLPTSHTCFNVLLLPEYSSKEKLEDRLLKAINYSKGFGML